MNMKPVSYWHDKNNPNDLVYFQAVNTDILGMKFKKYRLNDAQNQDHNFNDTSIYFLLEQDDKIQSKIYVGQSINGLKRINDHIRHKKFWKTCFIFKSTNQRFSKTAIDFLEYYFINLIKKSDYILENKDLRESKPIVTKFDEDTLIDAAYKIRFLLSCHGIHFHEEQKRLVSNGERFISRSPYNAQLLKEEGSYIVLAGSELSPPNDHKRWLKQGRREARLKKLQDLCDDKLAHQLNNGHYRITSDIPILSPKAAAFLICGYHAKTSSFWRGLYPSEQSRKDSYVYILHDVDNDIYSIHYGLKLANVAKRIIYTLEKAQGGIYTLFDIKDLSLVFCKASEQPLMLKKQIEALDKEALLQYIQKYTEENLAQEIKNKMSQYWEDDTFLKQLAKRKNNSE